MKNKKPAFPFFADSAKDEDLSLSVLLGLQILTIFIASPLVDNSSSHYHWITDSLLTLMALISVFVVPPSMKRWVALFSFALCMAGLALGPTLTHETASEIIIVLSGLVFCGNLSWIVAGKVFNDGTVTLHRIRGAIVIYLNIALSFAFLDSLLAWFVPDAYSGLPKNMGNTIGTMVYFSLTTLTTTGYGDLVAVHPFARSLATLEAVIGQFYMGALIATLVGLHVSYRQSKNTTKN